MISHLTQTIQYGNWLLDIYMKLALSLRWEGGLLDCYSPYSLACPPLLIQRTDQHLQTVIFFSSVRGTEAQMEASQD